MIDFVLLFELYIWILEWKPYPNVSSKLRLM